MSDVLHVNSARSDVRGHQDAITALLKPGERSGALRLRAVAVNHGGVDAALVQALGDALGAALGTRENETAAGSSRSRWCTFPAFPADTSNACSFTFSEGLSVEPNSKRTGFRVYSFTRCATEPSSVAEKHIVCRCFGRIDAMRRIAGRNPMSSMRSASSRTSVCNSRK